MRDITERGELDPAGCVCRRCPAETFRRLNVVVRFPAPLAKGERKWRDNIPEGSDHPVTLNVWNRPIIGLVYFRLKGDLVFSILDGN